MASRADRALSFGAIAGDYDRLRPEPPAEAVRWLLPDRCQTAVDIGAGTGLFTRTLAGQVPEVMAVEPDPRMRAVLAGRSPGVRVLAGTAERIPLPGERADAAFVSSAWHWMDTDLAVPEIARVLRDGGRFGIVWTSRDRDVDWVHELTGLLRRPDEQEVEAGERDWHRRHEVTLPPGAPFGNVDTASFRFTRPMTIDALVGQLGTYSGMITASPADRAARLARAREGLHRRFPGTVIIDVPMRSRCWRADRLPRG